MKRYKNSSGESGVSYYESGADYINIRFYSPEIYTYNYKKPGKKMVEEMKRLAHEGRGLSTYISQHVKENYYSKS